MVSVMGLGSDDPEFKSPLAVELTPGGVDSACHPSEVGASLLVSCQNGDLSRIVPNSQGVRLGSTNALYRVWSQWMDTKHSGVDYVILKVSYAMLNAMFPVLGPSSRFYHCFSC